MNIGQELRNAYDNRDREALERAIARIQVALEPWPGFIIPPTGRINNEPASDCANPTGCVCSAQHQGGCLWRSSVK